MKISKENYEDTLLNIERITGKNAPNITIHLYDTATGLVEAVYGKVSPGLIPGFVRVFIDYENNIISTYDKEDINLYLFFLVCGKFNNAHKEWHDLISCYAKYNFCPADKIAVGNDLPFPQILYACNDSYMAAKARFFAQILEEFGFNKMIEWLESPDLIYYYKHVFGVECDKHIEEYDVSFYEKVLNGKTEADEDTRLALWVDDKYRAESTLEVFYSTSGLTKAAIKYHGHVLGIVNIRNGNVISYVTDYSAWERRRAEGYTRNNPYNEAEFMGKVLSYSVAESPKILEVCIGGGRKAKPFVENGYEYYGIDISDGMLGECRAVLGGYENLYIKNHNIFDGLPFENDFFDIVIECRAVFAENNPFIMEEISRVLRPGGVAFLGIGDNYEVWDKCSSVFKEQHQTLWELYKPAYFSYYNVTDKRTAEQKKYGLELPQPPGKKCPKSSFSIPEPIAIFTPEQPFSSWEYEYDYIKDCIDNKYHMAFFRTEPMFEPGGTDFFNTLEYATKESFGNTKGKCTRITELKLYQF